MRKFKEVKRKEIIYDTKEWAEVERRAASVSMQTSEFIRRMSLDGKINYLEMKNLAPLLNGMKIIGNNINQIAKKQMKSIPFTRRIWRKYERRTPNFADY